MVQPTDLAALGLNPARQHLFVASSISSIPSNTVIPSNQMLLARDTGQLYVGDGITQVISLLAVGVNSLKPITIPSSQKINNIYNSATNAYNVTPSSTAYMKAAASMALAGLGRFESVCIGTSITGGTGAATRSSSWPAYLHNFLVQGGYPDGGEGVIVCSSNISPTTDPRLTIGSGWVSDTVNQNNFIKNITTQNPVTWVASKVSTIVDLYYFDQSTAGFTWTIDGSAQTAITGTGSNLIKRVRVSGLSSAIHTVIATPTNNDSTHAAYLGACGFMNTFGVVTHNLGVGGIGSANISANAFISPLVFAKAIGPQNAFIESGANDGTPPGAGGSFNAGAYINAIQAIINGMSSIGAQSCIVTEPPAGFATRPNAYTVQYSYYLADLNNIPLIDIQDAMISWTLLDSLGLGYDTDGLQVHLSSAGYAKVGQVVSNGLGL